MSPNKSKAKAKAIPGRLHYVSRLHVPGFGDRAATLYLPAGYDRGDRRFKVLYIFDGQNVFGDHGSYAGGWHLDALLNKRAGQKKEVPIVVAIHNGGNMRIEELSPWTAMRGHPGRADAYLDWLTGSLKPLIEKELPVETGPVSTLIGGASLGGLMALYAFYKRPDIYGGALAMSPSLWVGRGAMFRFVANQTLPWTRRVYLDGGGREGMLASGERMAEVLRKQGYTDGNDLMWRPDKRGSHNEKNWARRLPKAIKFFYG